MPFHESIGLLSMSLKSSSPGHSLAVITVDERMLGREHHVRGAEQRVGARREHLDLDVVEADDRKLH